MKVRKREKVISAKFNKLRNSGKKALIPYVMGGYPNGKIFQKILIELSEAGADLIEVGLPFSDPLADGVTIQAASEKVLADGINTDKIFDLIRPVRNKISPLIFMTYFNVVYRYGIERFLKNAVAAGFSGAIIPDLPIEEKEMFKSAAAREGIETIFLLAPTSTKGRILDTVKSAEGFIYCVSLTGVTGVRASISRELPRFINEVRKVTDLPLAVGFGISRPEHAKNVCRLADGAIIGSALINLINVAMKTNGSKKRQSEGEILRKVNSFITGFRKAIDAN